MSVEPSEQPRQEAQPDPAAGADGAAPSQDAGEARETAHAAEHAPENPDTPGTAEQAPATPPETTTPQSIAAALADTAPADPADAVATTYVPLPPKSTEIAQTAQTEGRRPSQDPEATAQATQPSQPSQSPQTAAPAASGPPAAPAPPTAPATVPAAPPQDSQTPNSAPTAPAAPPPALPATQPAAPQQPQPQQPPQPHPTFPLPAAGPGAALAPPPGAAAAAAAAQPLYQPQPPVPPYQGPPPAQPGPPMQPPPGQMPPPWGWGQPQPPYAAYPPPQQGQVPPPYQHQAPPPGWPQPPLAQTMPEGQSQTQPQQAPQSFPQPQIGAQPQVPPQPVQFAQQPVPPAQQQQQSQEAQRQPQQQADPQQQQQPAYSYPYPPGAATWEQQQAWAQGQQPGYPQAPGATGRSKVRLWLMIGIPTLVLVIIAAVVVVLTTSSTPSSNVAKVDCNPSNLATCLVQAPPAASKYANDWGSTTSVSAGDYAAQYADAAEQAESEDAGMVGADGEKSIVHRDWYVGGDQVDIILLEFATPQGAQAWQLDRSGNFMAQFRGSSFAVTGDSSAQAYAAASPNSSGDIQVGYASLVGTTVLEVHYASHGGLDKANFENWAGTQYASLQTAPKVTPSPSPSATSSQNTTCPGNISACLMPRPAGYSPWTDPSHNSSYSISGYTSFIDYANSSGQQEDEERMTADGVLSINDEDWANSDASDQGWLVLMQTRSDQGAQDLETNDGGGGTFRPQSFTISGFSNAVGSYSSTANSSGLFSGLVAAQVGTVYMEMWLFFGNSFDVGTAQAWAVEELTLLTQNTAEQGIPIPQVTTPTLSSPSPATCAAGSDGCLMAVPGGATSTTSSSYATNTSLTVSNYVYQYFQSTQNYESTWLDGDGATGASHETWIAGDGATADDVLLKFGTGQEAQAAVHKLVGDQIHGTQSCSVANLQNGYCLVQPQDVQSGSVPISVLAWKGDYVMDLEVSQIGSVDSADALNWALQQLAELPGG